MKAKDADVFAFTEQDYDDSPDIFVSGPDLVRLGRRRRSIRSRRVPLGPLELVDYTSPTARSSRVLSTRPATSPARPIQ